VNAELQTFTGSHYSAIVSRPTQAGGWVGFSRGPPKPCLEPAEAPGNRPPPRNPNPAEIEGAASAQGYGDPGEEENEDE
jgi:hypothetical protein